MATGHLTLAASLYSRAAQLAQRPWIEEVGRATALDRAGLKQQSRAACQIALEQNPLEATLRTDVCADVVS